MRKIIGLGIAVGLMLMAASVSAQVTAPEIVVNDFTYQVASDYSAATSGDAFLVYVDGTLVFEAYHNGYDGTRQHLLASGTKSFACALAVAAAGDGLLHLDEPAVVTLTEWAGDPLRSSITIRDLLSLTSGLPSPLSMTDFDVRDKLALALQITPNAIPGQLFQYGATNFYLFSEILSRKLGADAVTYLQTRILNRIGMENLTILRDSAGNPNFAGGGLTTAREWAKFGQLILQQGIWDGEQILDPDLLTECFYGTDANPFYGLAFWLHYAGAGVRDFTTADPPPRMTPDGFIAGVSTPNIMVAAGAGNQRLYIIPSENMVIVRLARDNRAFSDRELIRLVFSQ